MREILADLSKWHAAGKQIALATVVKIYGSAPRGLGAKMAVNEDGEMTGSVSGGCVEGAVVVESLEVIRKQAAKLLHYGVTQDQAIQVGLACGGEIDIFVEPLDAELFTMLNDDLSQQRLIGMVKVIKGEETGAFILADLDGEKRSKNFPPEIKDSALIDLEKALKSQQSSREMLGERELFFDVLPPEPKMVIVGAVHIAIPLVKFARETGFYTIVLDPRSAFATEERFGHADALIKQWPQEYFMQNPPDEGTYVVTVSHDEKLDVPAMAAACQSKAYYVGALGSKKTFAGYRTQMASAGVDVEKIDRILSPVGLEIGARGPEEIALAIIAQVVKRRNGLI